MSNWSINGFQNLLSVNPQSPAGGAPTVTKIDLSDLTRYANADANAQIFGCNCSVGPKSGLSQAEMEAAWRENGAL